MFSLDVHIFSRIVFFFNDTATTEIYTLSLHDALPIFHVRREHVDIDPFRGGAQKTPFVHADDLDRKSTRLNSSHGSISYAVFCLKKKKANKEHQLIRRKFERCSAIDDGITGDGVQQQP